MCTLLKRCAGGQFYSVPWCWVAGVDDDDNNNTSNNNKYNRQTRSGVQVKRYLIVAIAISIHHDQCHRNNPLPQAYKHMDKYLI